MKTRNISGLTSLGLGGDGDEADAIANVEARFNVKLDYEDASGWVTVGNVFDSLKRALTAEQRNAPDLWERFADAISEETGANPNRVVSETLLLVPSLWESIARRFITK